ncbi:unnamed protein product [Owenia fusiformis]|uniref:SOCS box domain-containing protein n=1 Tax=Owenia fusiformis TaxID=6347 RepID=A0A8S4Q116_OWEFU|nr:unnamed protein product [Owenia fusiformis]
MHVHFEENHVTRCECVIQSLSWMGKVPDNPPESDGWKLNRAHYYQEGWISTGNIKGTVGVTYTSCKYRQQSELPTRTNFNLRGHRSEVVIVRWNEPYQKLATCDANGIIYVWIKHEGRWSIELVNDRNIQVMDFSWSHDGRMALICYRDGFVLVGSVAGQRYWSTTLTLDNSIITCGLWMPDDQKVLFGTNDGQIVTMNSNGGMISQVTIQEGAEITAMAWSCEKFNMEEPNDETDDTASQDEDRVNLLAICFKYGAIYLTTSVDDVCPKIIYTGLTGLKMEWSNDGEVLCVGGFVRQPNLECKNRVDFYTREGSLRFSIDIHTQTKPLTAVTWGHNDKRLFIAVGCYIFIAWVNKHVSSLQYLCRRNIQKQLRVCTAIQKLPLPTKLKSQVAMMFMPTIKGCTPDAYKLREFVSQPPNGGERLYCTMLRHGDENSGYYTLYLEFLGGLIPLLKGKRASKLKPEFVIFDPKIRLGKDSEENSSTSEASSGSDSDNDIQTDGCGSPRMKRKMRQKPRKISRVEGRDQKRPIDEILYDDNLPENSRLVSVTSNIWGTKFKIYGTNPAVPDEMGSITYKTSLLHLQPRQMTVIINDTHPRNSPIDGSAGCSEDEESNGNSESSFTNSTHCGIDVSEISHITAQSPKHFLTEPLDGTIVLENTVKGPSFSRTDPNADYYIMDKNFGEGPIVMKSPMGSSKGSSSPESTNSNGFHLENNSDLLLKETHLEQRTANDKVQLRQIYATQGAIPKSLAAQRTKKVGSGCGDKPSEKKDGVLNQGYISIIGGSIVDGEVPRWANRASSELKYIDDEMDDITLDVVKDTDPLKSCHPRGLSSHGISVNSGAISPDSSPTTSLPDNQKRLILAPTVKSKDQSAKKHSSSEADGIKDIDMEDAQFEISINTNLVANAIGTSNESSNFQNDHIGTKDDTKHLGFDITPKHCGRPRKLSGTGGTAFPESTSSEKDTVMNHGKQLNLDIPSGVPTNPCCNIPIQSRHSITSLDTDIIEEKISNKEFAGKIDRDSIHSSSLPNSPAHRPHIAKRVKSKHDIPLSKNKVRSPLFTRKMKNCKSGIDSSDDESVIVCDDVTTGRNYKNLETFQKSQLRQKLRKVKYVKGEVEKSRSDYGQKLAREFTMHNKAPLWNENSQVYQLDFGGRVTQESAKNFQIDLNGKQVMQFGRIDGNAYTLDFQHPFSALQAFSVALANVTQRLK